MDAAAAAEQHPPVTDTERVATRIAGLCLDRAGHLPDNAYLAMAVRGGLLIDLALAGRLAQTEDSIDVDSALVGWAPADRALAELRALDGQSLDWWLEHSELGLADLARAQVEDRAWEQLPPHARLLRPRYAERNTGQRTHDLALLTQSQAPSTVEDAAVVSIAAAAGPPSRRSPQRIEELLARTGPVRWVCELVIDDISSARDTGTAVAMASEVALLSGIVP